MMEVHVELLTDMGFVIFAGVIGWLLYRAGVKDGFAMGRMTVNQSPHMPPKPKAGQPLLAEYDAYADAMGDDDLKDTIKER